jgi:hypothetical protein
MAALVQPASWDMDLPWALNFTDNAAATRSAAAVGFLIIVSEVFTFWGLRFLEEWIDVLLGAWLVISAWLLDISAPMAKVDFIISGLTVVLLPVYEIWTLGNHPNRRRERRSSNRGGLDFDSSSGDLR